MTLRERVRRAMSSPPIDEAARCENQCGIIVAPGRGVRDQFAVYCSEHCADEMFYSRTW